MPLSRDESKRKKQLANLEKGKFKKGGVGNPKGRPPKHSPRKHFRHGKSKRVGQHIKDSEQKRLKHKSKQRNLNKRILQQF